MKLTERKILMLLKLCLSAVILQLFLICLALGDGVQSEYITQVPEMLEYAAMATVVTLGGGLALEYALKVYG